VFLILTSEFFQLFLMNEQPCKSVAKYWTKRQASLIKPNWTSLSPICTGQMRLSTRNCSRAFVACGKWSISVCVLNLAG